MFAGKTCELIRLTERYKLAHKNVIVVKSAKDNRYSTTTMTTTLSTTTTTTTTNTSCFEAAADDYICTHNR